MRGTTGRASGPSTAEGNGSDAALELARAVTVLDPLRQGRPIRRDAIFRRLLALADLMSAAGGVAAVIPFSQQKTIALSAAAIPLIVLLAKLTGRYDHDEVVLRKSTLEEVPALMTLAAAYALSWSVVSLLVGAHSDRAGVIVMWGVTAFLLIILRSAARVVGQHAAPRERVLIVGRASARNQLARSLQSDPGARIEIVGFLPLEDERSRDRRWGEHQTGRRDVERRGRHERRRRNLAFDDLDYMVRERDIHRVFLIPDHTQSEMILEAVSRTTDIGVKVSIVPRLFEVVGSAVEFDTVGGVTVLSVRRAGLTRSSRAVKRGMDVVGASLGLIMLAPLGALIAVAIKLDTRGPVFFRQRRVGRDGDIFEMIKFRSMIDEAESQRRALEELNESHGTFKLSSDPRVTRVGRLLRKTSIDELPQLINVLRGDMSLVGPRPLVIDEDRLVEGRHRSRLQLAPGMTGPWQVLGPTRPPLTEMIKTDYLYSTNWSLWSDLKLLLRTLAHVAGQRGR